MINVRKYKYELYFVYTMYNSTELTVRKWGNSLGMRIPKHLAEVMNIMDGTKVRLTFKKDHVEMRISDEELEIAAPVHKHNRKHVRILSPNYDGKLRGRRTPLTLKDKNFEEAVRRYPFLIVLFIDYMYLDFYDRIEERLVQMKELAETYKGLVWFGVARIEENELAREKYVGNVWSEEEVRGFVNGRLMFKSGKLTDVEEVIERILPEDRIEEVKKRESHSVPIMASIKNMNRILSSKPYIVSGFFPPGEKEGIQLFNELAKKYQGKIIFTLTTDRVLFNEDSRTFYRNPLFERFNVIENKEILLFNRGTIVKRETTIEKEEIINHIDIYLAQGGE